MDKEQLFCEGRLFFLSFLLTLIINKAHSLILIIDVLIAPVLSDKTKLLTFLGPWVYKCIWGFLADPWPLLLLLGLVKLSFGVTHAVYNDNGGSDVCKKILNMHLTTSIY